MVEVNGHIETLPPDTLIRCCDGVTTRTFTARTIERELTIPGGETADWLRNRVLPDMIQDGTVLNV